MHVSKHLAQGGVVAHHLHVDEDILASLTARDVITEFLADLREISTNRTPGVLASATFRFVIANLNHQRALALRRHG